MSGVEWAAGEFSPIAWDATRFGLGRLAGRYGRLATGEPAVELPVPYEQTSDLHRHMTIEWLAGEGDEGSIIVRRLQRVDVGLSSGQHRILRYRAELAVECPWEGEGFPPGGETFEFDAIKVGIRGLPQWLGSEHGWYDRSPDEEHIIQPRWQETTWPGVTLDGARLTLEAWPSWEGKPPERWSLGSRTRLRIDLPGPMHLSDSEDEWVRPLQRCIELARCADSPITALWVSRVEWPSAAPTVHDRLWAKVVAAEFVNEDDWLGEPMWSKQQIRAEQLGAHLVAVRAWAYPTTQLARAVSESSDAEVAFSQSVTALEGLLDALNIPAHGRLKWAEQIDDVKAALKQVPGLNSDTRRALLKKVDDVPPLSLADRFVKLDACLGAPMRERMGSNAWSGDIPTLRNKALHGVVPAALAPSASSAFRVASWACQGLALLAWHDLTGSDGYSALSRLDDAAASWPRVAELSRSLSAR